MTVPPDRVLATICARGGSKGIINKNIHPLLGKPLLAYTIECARACLSVGHIVVSTDSEDIAAAAEKCGIPVPFRRPPEMASDTASKIHAIRHATQYVEQNEGFHPEIVVDLDVTVPQRSPEDITACVNRLASNPDLDALVTIYDAERNPYYTMVEFEGSLLRLVKQPPKGVIRRQDAPAVYGVSGSVFAFRRSSLMSITHLYEGRWGGCQVPRERAIEADDQLGLQFVEFLMSRKAHLGSP